MPYLDRQATIAEAKLTKYLLIESLALFIANRKSIKV
jgi:hypothetical protein